MKQKTLSKSEIKEVNEVIKKYNVKLNKKDAVFFIEKEDIKLLKINKNIDFFYYEDEIIPTLKNKNVGNFLKKVTVDMGAIKFVCSGADIMRPGIVEVEEEIEEGDIVVVVDVNNKKPLAIGKALLSSDEIRKQGKGKSVKSLHYVGDKIWDFN